MESEATCNLTSPETSPCKGANPETSRVIPYWRISDPPSGVLEGNNGGTAVVQSEELWGNIRGTRLGGIGRNRQTQGEFVGGVVERYWSHAISCPFPLSIAQGNCRDCQGIMGELQGLFRMRGMARTLCHVGESQGLHYIGEL